MKAIQELACGRSAAFLGPTKSIAYP